MVSVSSSTQNDGILLDGIFIGAVSSVSIGRKVLGMLFDYAFQLSRPFGFYSWGSFQGVAESFW